VDDWGERNTKKQAPACFVLNIDELQVTRVPGQASDVSYGQPCWTPSKQLIMVPPRSTPGLVNAGLARHMQTCRYHWPVPRALTSQEET
jgi:Acylamino-acid-releasing enzyme, N-terminal domain